MVLSKKPLKALIKIKGMAVGQMSALKYLGAIKTQNCDPKIEIKIRIEQARITFNNMKNLFKRSELSPSLRMRMIRCYIFSVLLYGCKSWTLDPSSEERIDAFEMHLYRRMLRLSWIQKITNEEVLRRMDKRKELMNAVMQRKTLYFGHTMRG